MKLYLRNFESYNDIMVFNSESLKTRAINRNDNIKSDNIKIAGAFKFVFNKLLCFFRVENALYIFYDKTIFDINDILKFSQNEFENVLKIKTPEKDIVIEEERKGLFEDYLTISETEDYNFLEFIYNVYQDKKRQELIFNSGMR